MSFRTPSEGLTKLSQSARDVEFNLVEFVEDLLRGTVFDVFVDDLFVAVQ